MILVSIMIAGRVEAKMTVPSGVEVSATVANGGSAATVTPPAGNYFLTAAGGVSGLLSTLEAQLNAKHDLMGFPRTAAVMSTVAGGDWTNGVGFLFQDASGNPASTFGTPASLTASGSPTYQNDGIKDGDYAIGFDANSERLSGGNVLNAGATDDLMVAWIGYHAANAASTVTLVSKRNGSSTGWIIRRAAGGNLQIAVHDGVDAVLASVAHPTATWYVGFAVLERGATALHVAACPLGGSATVSSATSTTAIGDLTNANAFTIGAQDGVSNGDTDFLCSALYAVTGSGVAAGMAAGLSAAITSLAAAVNASWTVALDTSDGTGRVAIGWSGYATPTHSVSFTSTDLRDLLGFDADITGAVTTTTGASAAKGAWFPNAAMDVGESDPRRAPRVTDLRTTSSPTGGVKGIWSTGFRRHTNVRWPLVPEGRVWESSADYTNGSWETFFADTQLGEHAWFDVCSPVQIYDHVDNRVGQDANVAGWKITGIDAIDPKRVGDWTGLWTIELPEIKAET